MKLGFKANTFRTNLTDMKDRIDGGWTDYAMVSSKFFEEHKKKNPKKLIDLRNKLDAEDPARSEKKVILNWLIAYQLELPDPYSFRYMLDILEEHFELIEDEIRKITKFKDHRHKTIHGLYTEKPVY